MRTLIDTSIYQLYDQDRISKKQQADQTLLIDNKHINILFGSDMSGKHGTEFKLKSNVVYICILPPYQQILDNRINRIKKWGNSGWRGKYNDINLIMENRERLIYWAGYHNFKLYPSFDILFKSHDNGKIIFNSDLIT